MPWCNLRMHMLCVKRQVSKTTLSLPDNDKFDNEKDVICNKMFISALLLTKDIQSDVALVCSNTNTQIQRLVEDPLLLSDLYTVVIGPSNH